MASAKEDGQGDVVVVTLVMERGVVVVRGQGARATSHLAPCQLRITFDEPYHIRPRLSAQTRLPWLADLQSAPATSLAMLRHGRYRDPKHLIIAAYMPRRALLPEPGLMTCVKLLVEIPYHHAMPQQRPRSSYPWCCEHRLVSVRP